MALLPSSNFLQVIIQRNLYNDPGVPLKLATLKVYTEAPNGALVEQTPITITSQTGVTGGENLFDGNPDTFATFTNGDWDNGVILEFSQPIMPAKILIDNSVGAYLDEESPGAIIAYNAPTLADIIAYNNTQLCSIALNEMTYDRCELELGVRRKIYGCITRSISISVQSGTYDSVSIELDLAKLPGEVYSYSASNPVIAYSVDGFPPTEDNQTPVLPWIIAQKVGTFTLEATAVGNYTWGPSQTRDYVVANTKRSDYTTPAKFWRIMMPNKGVNEPIGNLNLFISEFSATVRLDVEDLVLSPKAITSTGITSIGNIMDRSTYSNAVIPKDPKLLAEFTLEYAEPVVLVDFTINNSGLNYWNTPEYFYVYSADTINGPYTRRSTFRLGAGTFANPGPPYKAGYLTFQLMPTLLAQTPSGIHANPFWLGFTINYSNITPYLENPSNWTLAVTTDGTPVLPTTPIYGTNVELTTSSVVHAALKHIASDTLLPTKEYKYTISSVQPQFLLRSGLLAAVPASAKPGELLIAIDQTALFIGDEYGGKELASTIHIGSDQPLANKTVWIDNAKMELKYKTDTTWDTPSGKAQEKDLGGFIDEVVIYPNANGDQYITTKIVLTSMLERPVYYTLDGTEPTELSTLYTLPLAMLTGTIKAKSIYAGFESPVVERTYNGVIPIAMSYVWSVPPWPLTTGDTGYTITVDTSLLSDTVNFFTEAYPEDIGAGYYLDASGNMDATISPEDAPYQYSDSWSMGRTIVCTLAKLDGTIVEQFEIYNKPAAPVLSIDFLPQVEGDNLDLIFDSMINGNDWGIYGSYNNGPPTVLSGMIKSVADGDGNVTLTPDELHPGTWELALIYNRGSIFWPAKTRNMSNVISVTMPGTYVAPPPVAIWEGYGATFEKLGTDPVVEQDYITAKVSLTRGSDGGFFNITKEAGFDQLTSPKNTKWAFFETGPNTNSGIPEQDFNSSNYANLNFSAWRASHDSDAWLAVGRRGVVWLQEDNIYMDIQVLAWGDTGDTFKYRRSTASSVRLTGAPTVYSGYDVTYTKVKADDPTVVKDVLSPSVTISRFNAGGPIVNLNFETDYIADSSPLGTRWAFCGLNGNSANPADLVATNYANLIFEPFRAATGGTPPDVMGAKGVCWLLEENIVFDIEFSYWGEGGTYSGELTYTRATLPVVTESIVIGDISKPKPNPTGEIWNGATSAEVTITSTATGDIIDTIVPDYIEVKSVLGAAGWFNNVNETMWNRTLSPRGMEFAFCQQLGNPSLANEVVPENYANLKFYAIGAYAAVDLSTLQNIACVAKLEIGLDTYAYTTFVLNSWDSVTGNFSYTRRSKPVAPTIYWKGLDTARGAISFDSPDYANTVDSISPTVSLTRAGTGQLYNTLQEAVFVQNVSPLGAKFAFSNLGPNASISNITASNIEQGWITPIFTDIRTANANNSTGMVGKLGVLYLEAEKTYVDIMITRWSPTAGTGGFTYTRATVSSVIDEPVHVTVTAGGFPQLGHGTLYIDGVAHLPGTYPITQGNHTFTHVGNYLDVVDSFESRININDGVENLTNVASPAFASVVYNVTKDFTAVAEFGTL